MTSKVILRAIGASKPISIVVFALVFASKVLSQDSSAVGQSNLRPLPDAPTAAQDWGVRKVELSQSWDEQESEVQSVAFFNPKPTPITVIGVQSSRGVFVIDYPKSLAANSSGLVQFLYSPVANAEGESESIRLLTSEGVDEVVLSITRERIAAIDSRTLIWQVGEAALPKSAVLSLSKTGIVPSKVSATNGHAAVLEKIDSSSWRIWVTPKQTEKVERFAVFVELNKPIPGFAPLIVGEVARNR